MSKDSLNRVKGEGSMPANTLTRQIVEDLRARNLIIRDFNEDNQSPQGNPPGNPNWNRGGNSGGGYQQGGPPPGNNEFTGLKRSREKWGENPNPPPYPKRY